MQQRRQSAIPPRRSAVQSQLLAKRQVQQQQVDTEEEDYPDMPRMPTSTRRYYDTRGNEVIQQGNRRLVIHYDEPPPKKHRVHWMLILGLGMMLMLWLYIGFSWAANWWTNRQLDATYGFPRTYQVDAIVGRSDSVAHPSHFIFLNLNGRIEIIELPGGDATNAKIYIGPTLFSDNAPFVPVTGEFRNVGGKEEMIIHIQDQQIIYVSNGTKFVLKP